MHVMHAFSKASFYRVIRLETFVRLCGPHKQQTWCIVLALSGLFLRTEADSWPIVRTSADKSPPLH